MSQAYALDKVSETASYLPFLPSAYILTKIIEFLQILLLYFIMQKKFGYSFTSPPPIKEVIIRLNKLRFEVLGVAEHEYDHPFCQKLVVIGFLIMKIVNS